MTKSKSVIAAVAAVCVVLSCGSGKKHDDPVALIVNGEEIRRSEIDEAAEFFRRQQMMISPESVFGADADGLRRGAARQLAANYLMTELVKEMGWEADSARVETMVQRFIAQFPDRETFMAQLAAMGESEETMRKGMSEELLLDSLITMVSNRAAPVEDGEVRAFFERNKERYAAPPKVRASHIIFEISLGDDTAKVRETMERAVKAMNRAKAGEDFDALIKEYSSKPTMGDMGWFSQGDLVPELENAIFALPKGGISELVPSSMGMHIIKKIDEAAPRPMTFEEVGGSVRRTLEFNKKGTMVNEYVDSLLAAADIKYIDESLKPVQSASDSKTGGDTAATVEASSLTPPR